MDDTSEITSAYPGSGSAHAAALGLVSRWRPWWQGLTARQRLQPAVLIGAFWLVFFALGGLRGEHLLTGSIILALSYGGPDARKLLQFVLPLFLTGVVYDSQRFYSDLIRGPIHVREPYDFDKRFFGIETAQGTLTPNEWLQLHTHPALDLVTGFYYLTFILIFVGIAGYFRFFLSRKGTRDHSGDEVRADALRMMWAFFWVNVIGYSTYYWYAAAPPWYVTLHGFGPVRLDAAPNPAGAIRFDELVGFPFFKGMYSKSADVFGAIPSLHVAYPLLALLYSWRLGRLRVFCFVFYAIMCFAAVYLNHHYVLDLIWGSAYALGVAMLVNRWNPSRPAPAQATSR